MKTTFFIAILALSFAVYADIFFVETPGGVRKLEAKDRLWAAVNAGTTVWTESEWKDATNRMKEFALDLDVVDMTKDLSDDFSKKTNSAGLVYYEEPSAKTILELTNVGVLKLGKLLIVLPKLTADQMTALSNAYPRKVTIQDLYVGTREVRVTTTMIPSVSSTNLDKRRD